MTTTYKTYDGATVKLSAHPVDWLYSSAIGVTLNGTSGADSLSDIAGGSTLSGGAGDDTYMVTDPRTRIIEAAGAAGGTDTVDTYIDFVLPQNVEIINALSNNISIISNAQGGLLLATGQGVKLIGASGADVMVDMGAGHDTFEFSQGGGHDAIYGFQTSGAAEDYIQLQNYGFTSFAQVQSDLKQVGTDVVLTLSATDAIVIRNTQLSSLTASNFLLQLDTTGMKMSFDEEFNSLSLYNAKTGQGIWTTSYDQWGPANGPSSVHGRTMPSDGEQEAYVDPGATGLGSAALGLNPFSIANGVLTITAQQTPAGEQATLYGMPYISGLLTTQHTFAQTYGYFEMKAEFPSAQGTFPAFWLLPEDMSKYPAELDVFEHINGYNNVSQGYGSASGGNDWFSSVPTATTGFNTYGMLWTKSTITWYVNGVETNQIQTPADLNSAMFLLTNLAVGGNWAGSANFKTAGMAIDYIHVYTLAQSPVQAALPTTYVIQSATDVAPSTANVIQSAFTYSLAGTTAHFLDLTGSANINATANNLGDNLTGNAGSNLLKGGTGNDVITAGTGADTLTGGGGTDTFVFNQGSGHDVITDFGGHDVIDISAYLQAGYKASLSDSGGNAFLTFSTGTTIELLGVHSSSLIATTVGFTH